MLVAYALGAVAALFLVLSLASYSVSTGVLNHVGEQVGAGCVSCTLVLPLLIKTGVYGAISAISSGLAAWFAISNEREQVFSSPEPEFYLEDVIEIETETKSDEQSLAKAERSSVSAAVAAS